ncbi:MAG: hypothetical protein LUC41_06490 [Clostridiales bacterium]|nr:hypothetical protein [Clostridiales bacterium]
MRKKIIALIMAMLLSLACTGCGGPVKIDKISILQSFDTDIGMQSGHLTCQVDYAVSSDNVTDLGLSPSDMTAVYDDYCVYNKGSKSISVEHPVDTTTGQLSDHLLAVLVQVTVTNVDAVSYEGDGTVFSIDEFQLCDTNVDRGSKYGAYDSWSCTWYSGTGDYDASAYGTSGSNYFVLSQGERLTFQMAFIVGNADDDFSGICLTDGTGSYRGDVHFVDLGL